MNKPFRFFVVSFLLLSVFVSFFLVGCNIETPSNSAVITDDETIISPSFELLGNFDDGERHFLLYRDTFTDLVYLCMRYKDGYAGGISLLPYYDVDGSHMTYSRYCELCDINK